MLLRKRADPGPAQEDQMTATVTDPVCGMLVDPEQARDAQLVADHEGHTYAFCGKGCKLEFQDDPKRFLDPSYKPDESMM
jgi:YHS domain-containing protein